MPINGLQLFQIDTLDWFINDCSDYGPSQGLAIAG